MARDKNFLARVFDAMMVGREQQAKHYIERYQREYGKLNDKLTKR